MRRLLLTLCWITGCTDGAATAFDASAGDVLVDASAPRDRADVPAPQRVPIGGACSADGPCDDGVFCNGVERCASGRCAAGVDPCDDHATCTVDRCDEVNRRCANAPEGDPCGDGDLCNGAERCAPADPTADRASGCTRPPQGVDCNDNDPCTVDSCAPSLGCVHAPRDLDGDGHVDRACPRDGRPGSALGGDCDDLDPGVHPQVTERCGDGRDNNCDGLIDLADAVACRPTNDECARAAPLQLASGEGVTYGTTATFAPGPALPCVDGAITRGTAWYRVVLEAPGDLSLRVEDGARSGELPGAVVVVRDCGGSLATRCASGTLAADAGAGADPELHARGLAAGVWYVGVQTAGARPFSLRARLTGPSDGGV